MAAQTQPAINLRALDSLRGLLAVYVVAEHAKWLLWRGREAWSAEPHAGWEYGVERLTSLLTFGREAVAVFFVLSGFFIHLRIAQQASAGGKVGALASFRCGNFFQRRAHRILPPYFLALAVTFACDWLGRRLGPEVYSAQTMNAVLNEGFAQMDGSLRALFFALFPGIGIVPSGVVFGSNTPLWSLQCEMHYYLWYPLWLMLWARGLWTACLTGLAIGVGASVMMPGGAAMVVLTGYPLWIAGAALAELVCRDKIGQRGLLILLGSFVAGAAMLALRHGMHMELPMLPELLAGVGLVGIFMSVSPKWSDGAFLRAWEFLGIRSYTIYVCHYPVILLLSALWYHQHQSWPAHGWLSLAGFAGTLAVCLILFELVERHFLHPRIRLRATS